MLYLAEVQKQKSGFMGAGKAEIKLLACQRNDQNWTPVPGEEVIPAEEANNLNAGALVLAELNANRQVKRIQEAGRPLITILQNFSRQMEKSKSLEEEIEQWKESLTYQSQELNSRNMEMEARLEQLQQMEDDFKRLQSQQQEIDAGREQVKRLQKEIERNRRELEGAWEHLRGEQRRVQEQQTELQQATLMDEATARQIQELLAHLSSGVAPTEAIAEQLNLSFEIVASGQGILNQHWQQFEQQRAVAQQQQEQVDYQTQALQNSFSEWQQAQNSLEQTKAELKVQMSALNSKQEYAQLLGLQLQNQEKLYQQISARAESSSDVNGGQKVDLQALEKMPLEQLQQLVQDLEQDLQNASKFVNDQEEELRFMQQTIDELQAKVNEANEYDRINLEMELADEQDSYQFLNETLVGQRNNLRSRQKILTQHSRVLWQRQGKGAFYAQDDNKIDFQPILLQIEAHKQKQAEELQKLDQQISQLFSSIEQVQGMIDNQAKKLEMKQQERLRLEENLMSLRVATAECWGRVNLYQEMLQPVQDSLDGYRQTLEAIAGAFAQMQETGDYQLQTIAQMRQTLLSFMPSPELAAS